MNINKNTLKTSIVTLLVYSMSFAVVLSHLHVKDTVRLLSSSASVSSSSAMASLTSTDLRAKSIDDLHHHVDKTMLKSITGDAGAVARTRELQPLAAEFEDDSLSARFQDFILRLRVVGSLCFHQFAFAYA